jgi:tetratricopeptide (TPR) repeat protein
MAIDPASSRKNIAQVVLVLALAGTLALLVWALSHRRAGHWNAVARARTYLDRGQPDLALKALSGIRDLGPGSAEALTLAARALLMQGSISAARLALERSLKMEPQQPDAAKMLAAIYLASGDGERGLLLLEQAARFDPADFRPWYAMGKVHHDLGRLEESAEAYAQALKRSPPASEARESRLGRIRALLDDNRAGDAAADLAKAREQAPDDSEVLALAAGQARDLGQLDEATALANRALGGDPENFDALLVRARIRFLSRSPLDALADLEKAVQINPNKVAALQLLLQVQTSLGKTAEAAQTNAQAHRTRERIVLMDQLAKAIHQRPNDPEPRHRMGRAALDGKMYVLAYQSFQAALDLDSNFKPAREALEQLRQVEGFDYKSVVASPTQVMGRNQATRH